MTYYLMKKDTSNVLARLGEQFWASAAHSGAQAVQLAHRGWSRLRGGFPVE